MPKVTIDNQVVEVKAGATILEAAQLANIKIPTLCYHPDQAVKANCRICVVEVKGNRLLQPACAFPVSEGMVVYTNNAKVNKARKNILELILSHHPQDCLKCSRSGNCELQSVTQDMNFTDDLRYPLIKRTEGKDISSPSVVRDPAKCILCQRCVYACSEVQTVHALSKENRSIDSIVTPAYGQTLAESCCINCGQCVQACPVGALIVKDDTAKVRDAIAAGKMIIGQVAPAVRITLAEALGEEPGVVSTGRLVTAMKMLGFDQVFDTDFTADLCIHEEGFELLGRVKNGGTLPMITSCSPGWIRFCETFYPDMLDNLSSCRSPQAMFGALIKTFYAEKIGKCAKDLYSVSIMPCTAKKFECKRPELSVTEAGPDVDVVLTVQELARMVRAAGIDFANLPDSEFDLPFGLGTGAGEIFGASGGVMEAALRTVYEVVTGNALESLDFEAVRGLSGIKEASVDLNGLVVKVAVAHGLGNARKLMDAVRAGRADYHFIEIM
ncbi:MAG: [FeFe] hydrogenase, group A, partial [Clostridiales bacterium]|nr:[FeFe] hydrogenase, group A [Clostridiales bacterium]